MTGSPSYQALMTVMRRPIAWSVVVLVCLQVGLLAVSGLGLNGDEEAGGVGVSSLVPPLVVLAMLGWPMLAWFSASPAVTVPGFRAAHERAGWGVWGSAVGSLSLAAMIGGTGPLLSLALPLGLAACFLPGNTLRPGREWSRGSEMWLPAALGASLLILLMFERPSAWHAAFVAGDAPLLSLALILASLGVVAQTVARLRGAARGQSEENLEPVMCIADRRESISRAKTLATSEVPTAYWPMPPAMTRGAWGWLVVMVAVVVVIFVAGERMAPDAKWRPLVEIYRWFGFATLPLVAVVFAASRLQAAFGHLPLTLHRPDGRGRVALLFFHRVLRIALVLAAVGMVSGVAAALLLHAPPIQTVAAGVCGGLVGFSGGFLIARTIRLGNALQLGLLFGIVPLLAPLWVTPLRERLLPTTTPGLAMAGAALLLVFAAAMAAETRRWLLRLEWGTIR